MNIQTINKIGIMTLLLSSYSFANAATLTVGPGKTYDTPCSAFNAAKDGDTVEIDARGNYTGNVCYFNKQNLSIKGVNGKPKIDAAGRYAAGKGTWVIGGNNNTVDNIEFTGASVPDRNGAGIRLDGKSLTVKNSYFHRNENGILTSNNGGDIVVENSEFGFNGYGDGYSHNLYIGHVDSLTFIGNYSHDANAGHNLKTRASRNTIKYNRFASTTGRPSYEIDVPNAGTTYIIGNVIQQPKNHTNPGIVTYGVEGATNPGKDLYVVNNTFINEGSSTARFIFVGNQVAQPVLVQNNLFIGTGTQVSQGIATVRTNYATLTSPFKDQDNFRPDPSNASIVNAGTNVKERELMALMEYKHVAQTAPRAQGVKIDIGAYEAQAQVGPVIPGIRPILDTSMPIIKNAIRRNGTPVITPIDPIEQAKPVPLTPDEQSGSILINPFSN